MMRCEITATVLVSYVRKYVVLQNQENKCDKSIMAVRDHICALCLHFTISFNMFNTLNMSFNEENILTVAVIFVQD